MGRLIDMTNWRMCEHGVDDSHITVLKYLGNQQWQCKCDCGNIFSVRGAEIRNGHVKGCGCLRGNHNLIDETGKEYDGFKVIEQDISIKNHNAYWKCQCKYCGRIFTAKGTTIRKHEILSCGCQSQSQGEQEIQLFLDTNNIQYKTQERFIDCHNRQSLPFDFTIYNNDNLQCCIEFQGLQHSLPVKNYKEFYRQVKCDIIKEEYCKTNHIPLFVI